MSSDELRGLELDACDRVLNAGPFARRFIDANDRKLARANRAYWSIAGEAELQKLATCYGQANRGVRDEPPEPEAETETEETT